MKKVTLFSKSDCHLCTVAKFALDRLASKHAFELEVVDIEGPGHHDWNARYKDDIPVIHVQGREICRHRVDERACAPPCYKRCRNVHIETRH